MTSNKSISELFQDNPMMIEPLQRRFNEIHAYSGHHNGETWYNDDMII